jgi:hypothetical protein
MGFETKQEIVTRPDFHKDEAVFRLYRWTEVKRFRWRFMAIFFNQKNIPDGRGETVSRDVF